MRNDPELVKLTLEEMKGCGHFSEDTQDRYGLNYARLLRFVDENSTETLWVAVEFLMKYARSLRDFEPLLTKIVGTLLV